MTKAKEKIVRFMLDVCVTCHDQHCKPSGDHEPFNCKKWQEYINPSEKLIIEKVPTIALCETIKK